MRINTRLLNARQISTEIMKFPENVQYDLFSPFDLFV